MALIRSMSRPEPDCLSAGLLMGRRILIVEDEFMIALDLEEELQAAGATVVGPVPSVGDAALLLAIARIDAAVLDIKLGDELVYPLADFLIGVGVPVVFATGCSEQEMPERFKPVRRCEKPVATPHLARVLSEALGGA